MTVDMNGRLVKRRKTENLTESLSKRQPRIFAPFRTLGLVSTTDVPFTYNNGNHQITTSVARALITYSLERGLNRIWITRPQTPSNITASFAWKKYVLAAFGDPRKDEPQGFWVFQRGDEIDKIELPRDLDEPITQIMVVGSWIIGCALTRVEVWKSTTLEHYTTIRCVGNNGNNQITGGICAMPTYLNKIFIGRKDGWVELWNVHTGKLIYTFVAPSNDTGAVTCLEPSPALSLLAIAYSDGRLVIQDILRDKPVVDVYAGTDEAPVTSIAFRTDKLGAGDDGREEGVMATATTASGDITFWDLNEGGRITGVLRSAHNPPSVRGGAIRGGINKIQYLPGEKVLVSSGLDNSLKTWIFDQTPFSPVPRILHSRSGHAGQVNCIQWLQSDFDGHEAGKKWILTGSEDRSLWGWSLRNDGQTTELSQGHLRKKAKKRGLLTVNISGQGPGTTLEDLKAPEITCIASSLNRDGGIGALPGNLPIWQKGSHKPKPGDAESSFITGWESVVTGHKGDSYARTWFWGRKRAGRWAFQTGDKTDVSAVSISTCGTFALVGSVGGHIDMFNLQSGLHRQKFPSVLTPAQARQLKMQQMRQADSVTQLKSGVTTPYLMGVGRHTKAVTGIVVSPVHTWVASCSLDGYVKFWDFLTGNLLHEIKWTSGITGVKYHGGTELLAFSCEDNCIRLVDIGTKHVVRQFRGPKDKINDICWSHDGRWIIAASQDRTIRVWDLPTGNMVDGIRLEKPCTSIAMAESNEYLATATEGEIGVNLWINRAWFRRKALTRHISEEDIMPVSGPSVSGESGKSFAQLEQDDVQDDEDEYEGELTRLVDRMTSELQTLSIVPKSKWQTLLHLDEIKRRNAPTEAPKAPDKAPFFLPSTAGNKSWLGGEIEKAAVEAKEGGSRVTRFEKSRSAGTLTMKLRKGAETGDYGPYIDQLLTLSPSQMDLEIRYLSSESSDLASFVRAMTFQRRRKRDFEMVEVWVKVFMQIHGEDISRDYEASEALREWMEVSKKSWGDITTMISYCSAAFSWFVNPET